MKKCLIGLVLVVAGALRPASAETIFVPQDFPTIQFAINAAQTSDVIVVSPGTYFENVHFLGKAITVTGTDPLNYDVVGDTRILGANGTAVVMFNGSEDKETILDGLTIVGGLGSLGHGINCSGASPTILRCQVTKNSASGIVQCDGNINGCTIRYSGTYGMLYCDGSIDQCFVNQNGSEGIYLSDARITNSIIANNDGNGIRACDGIIQNCTIVRNGVCGLTSCNGTIRNIVSWQNGSGTSLNVCSSSLPSFSIFKSDPMFISSVNDWRLSKGSPAINTGDPGFFPTDGETDFDGNSRVFADVVDIGAYEAPSMDCVSDFDEDGDVDCIDFDIDSDGIRNGADECDYTPLGSPIDEAGRPLGDVDRDCDTDLHDFALFQLGITGPHGE